MCSSDLFPSHDTLFVSVDPIEGGASNAYAYANDPVNKADSSGMAVETILDVASVGYDSYQMIKNPSWGNAGMLAWSVGAVFIPFIPGSYAGKAGAGVLKAVNKVSQTKNAPKT